VLKLDLFGAQLVGLDGTKLAAVNSKDANFNEKKLRELIQRADTQLAEYLQALDRADAAEPAHQSLSRADLQSQDRRPPGKTRLARGMARPMGQRPKANFPDRYRQPPDARPQRQRPRLQRPGRSGP
jgi:hypothetical protein